MNREAFEAWIKKNYFNATEALAKQDNGNYYFHEASEKWTVWQAAIASQAQQSQWISVEERLPEEGIQVAACGINEWLNKKELFCLGTTKLFCGNWLNVGHVTVTHWMPLPPAPEGE